MSITDENITAQKKIVDRALQVPLQIFYPASVIIFIVSVVILVSSYGKQETSATILLAGIVLSMSFLVAPAFIQYRTEVLQKYLKALDETENRLFDVDSVRREHRKTIMKLEELMEKADARAQEIAALSAGIAAQKKTNEELTELRQALAKESQKQEQWVDTMMDYCTFLNRTMNLPDLSPEYAKAVKKSADVLIKQIASLGLDVISPQRGDRFDDRVHQALDYEANADDVEPGDITRCLSFGYRIGSHVREKAQVYLAEEKKEV